MAALRIITQLGLCDVEAKCRAAADVGDCQLWVGRPASTLALGAGCL